ncbi:MAG: glycosyltransferase family 4 protein [candidate division KSB1 bacterium]|nr:glycosyltransferase family 4 protein [candidate division KSB1 bacterium]
MCDNARKKVAILSNYPADHATFTGGVETATAALLEGFRAYQSQFEFHIISVSPSIITDMFQERDGFFFHFLGVPKQLWLRPRFPFRIVKAYWELRRIRPDLVHCQDNMALALATIFGGYTRVFTVHGVKRHEASKRTGWEFWSANLDALIERYVHRQFNAFICISNYSARVVGNTRLTFLIPNPVPSLFFQTSSSSALQKSPYFLFVGVLAPLKRPLDLLLAHAELRCQFPHLRTFFCGEVEDAGYARLLHQTVIERGIEGVIFLGHVGQEKLADLLKGATALVLPSAQENAPMVLAEAMAAGISVVATRVGAIPEMVKEGETGLLYEVGNVHDLISCLRQLLMDPPLQRRLGSKAKKRAQTIYAPAQVAAATVAAYRQLIEQEW